MSLKVKVALVSLLCPLAIGVKPLMRSMKISSSGEISSPIRNCPTPSGSKWCRVHVPGVVPFSIAAYDGSDFVSNSVCSSGSWEDMNIKTLGPPGQALDIGGNIGYYTFVLAMAGWNVTSFEPNAKNVELMKATLCENPELNSQVTLHNVGLGPQAEHCFISSGFGNQGNGETRCGADAKLPPGHKITASFVTERLDDVLKRQGVTKVDYVKIDVEGFECQVFKGAPEFLLKYKPRLLHTEVWSKMQGCDPKDYLNMFATAGYQVAKDEECNRADMNAPTTPAGQEKGIKDFWICKDAKKSVSLLHLESLDPFEKRRTLLKHA